MNIREIAIRLGAGILVLFLSWIPMLLTDCVWYGIAGLFLFCCCLGCPGKPEFGGPTSKY